MGTIIQIPPKAARGKAENIDWTITYVRATKSWHWHVVITMDPIIVEGDCDTEAGAKAAVNDILHKFKLRFGGPR